MKLDANCDARNDMVILKKKIRRRLISNYCAAPLLPILAIILFVFRPFPEIDIFFGILFIIIFFLSPIIMKRDKVLNKWKSQLKELESQHKQLEEIHKKRFDD